MFLDLFNRYFIFIIFFITLSCNNKKGEFKDEEISNCLNKNVIDSLTSINYVISNQINFFNFQPNKSITYNQKGTSFYALKRENELINILKIECGEVLKNRIIKKYSDKYFIEEEIINNYESGEKDYITLYYSENKIIITIVTEDTFSDETDKFYLSKVFLIEEDFVTAYYYSVNSDLNLNTYLFYLSEKELDLFNDKNVRKLFFDEDRIQKYIYKNENFFKDVGYIQTFFDRVQF